MAGEKRRAVQFMGKNAIVAVIGQRFKLSKTKRNRSKQRDGRIIYVGSNGRTHIFEGEKHLTSFRTTKQTRERKVKKGFWQKLP